MFSRIICIILTSSLSAFAVDKAKVKAAAEKYLNQGKELMAMINSGKIDAAKAEKLSMEMADVAAGLLPEYISFDPKSEKLMKLVESELPKIKKANFQSLQDDYHDGGKLPASATGIDLKKVANEKYTDPIHTIVHPLMTNDLLKSNNAKKAKEELSEGMDQMKELAEQLK